MKKNILIFGHSYCTPFADVNTQYSNLFDKNKYKVTIVYLIGEPDETIKQKHYDDEVIFLDSPRETRRGLKFSLIFQMLKLCRDKRFDIVVSHRYKPTYIMMWVSKFCKIPNLIAVMHELNVFSNFFRKLMTAFLAPKNMIFAGVSNALRDDIRENIWQVPHEKITTLHNTIDTDFTKANMLDRETARQKLNLPQDAFLFGNIGRLAKNKNQKILIHAFSIIKARCPNAKLVIMGDGALEKSLKDQAHNLLLDNDVIFTGFVPNAFVYMKAFDVFTLTSSQETFGRVLLEAMLASIPIIATKVDGIPEVVGNTAQLVANGDIDNLAKEMLKAYELPKPELHHWGQQCYDRVMQCFSLQTFHSIFWQLPLTQSGFQP